MSAKNSPFFPGCLWAAENLLVRVRKATGLPLPRTLLRRAFAASVPVAVNLLSKEEFLDAGADALFGPLVDARNDRSGRERKAQPQVSMSYVFWPEPGELPTARQVRQALDTIEDAHSIGLRVLVNGVGHPARAAIVTGCWLAREGYGGDLAGERLHWLEGSVGNPAGRDAPNIVLSEAERAFVAEWPTGRDGQPELADMAWAERDEVFPFAPVEHWLRVLPTVRVYRGSCERVGHLTVPVVDGQRVSDGVDVDLDLADLWRGTWIGERTLRLPCGWEVVFVSAQASRHSSLAMNEPAHDSEEVLVFCRESRQGSLAAIRREARQAGIRITEEQIQRLILAPRARQEPPFDIEFYKRHL